MPLWLSKSKTLFEGRLINFRIIFLKTTKLFEFRWVGSKLFHSMITKEKKEFLKALCKKQNVISVMLMHGFFQVLISKGIGDIWICKFCKTFLVFCTNVVTKVILNLIFAKVFPERYLVSHQLWPSRHYTE